jgi:hypothetical protein
MNNLLFALVKIAQLLVAPAVATKTFFISSGGSFSIKQVLGTWASFSDYNLSHNAQRMCVKTALFLTSSGLSTTAILDFTSTGRLNHTHWASAVTTPHGKNLFLENINWTGCVHKSTSFLHQ